MAGFTSKEIAAGVLSSIGYVKVDSTFAVVQSLGVRSFLVFACVFCLMIIAETIFFKQNIKKAIKTVFDNLKTGL